MKTAFLRFTPVLLLAGCAVGPDYQSPEFDEATPFAAASSAASEESFPLDWWGQINDPVLQDLLRVAAEQNLDLKIAAARLREARAGVQAAGAANLPRLGAGGTATRQRLSENSPTLPPLPPGAAFPLQTDVYQAGFDAGWEIDLFGGNRRASEAATARFQAAVASVDDALDTVLAEVALNYVELRSLQQRAANVRRSIELQAETLKLVESLRDAGLAGDLEVSQARAQWLATQASLPGLIAGVDQRTFQIDVLLGTAPGTSLNLRDNNPTLPELPAEAFFRLPADVLRQRPDVRAIERTLAAETAEIGQAWSDLLPKFSLTGGFAVESGESNDLFTTASRTWSFGPGVQWAIFEGGRIRANIAAQTAQADGARATYEQVVLRALQEVDSAWVAHHQERQTAAHLTATVTEQQRTLELANTLYREGLSPLRDVLDAEARLIVAQNQLVESTARTWTTFIRLYKAMGGSS